MNNDPFAKLAPKQLNLSSTMKSNNLDSIISQYGNSVGIASMCYYIYIYLYNNIS